MKSLVTSALASIFLAGNALAEPVDLEVVHKIKQEAFLNSHVMDYIHLIADENGQRVAGSPGYRRAAEAAVAAMKEAGIDQAEIEPWGFFGNGWDWTRVAIQMKTPQETTLVGFPGDWSPGTDGPVSGEVAFAPLWEHPDDTSRGDLVRLAEQIEAWKDRHRGTLRGKIVMLDHPTPWELPEGEHKFRVSDEDLANGTVTYYDLPVEPGPTPRLEWPLVAYPVDKEKRSRIWDVMPIEFAADRWALYSRIWSRVFAFLTEEGATAVLYTGFGKKSGVIFHSDSGSYIQGLPIPPPSVALMPEHYRRIHRMLEREVPVILEVDVDAEFYPDQQGLNVIAEIPGQGRNPEVVMLGGHFDSWHGATGATDNATGSVVAMEVLRILRKLDLPMKRTVRVGLWGEEEVCLCGSRGYVAKHFADPVTMELKPGHEKLSAYFNMDNGTGKIRGVYLQQNDMARPILESWMAPFADQGVGTALIVNTTGTDHLSFNAVGLPGFSFIQDPMDYSLNTHHSNVDHVDHVSPGDLMQAVAVMATAVYHAATREEMMPRKVLPKPLPPKNELPDILK